ncbi:hypothetical protein J3458_020578 [Metarhizium acridum]|uniref:uncharacterized protein n=1 Tax=Metarhizium acridum TaxID=92637 RepID=UPI001C6CE98C|nr:hypothetical protein J3458_020578 [Metarhizium acridum]
MEDAALRKCFTFLRDQAIKQARKSQLTITAIMLSYPNYICDKNVDFDKYRSLFHLNLVFPLVDRV